MVVVRELQSKRTDTTRSTMVNVTSLKEIGNGEMDSNGTEIIDAKTLSDANLKKRKRRRKKKKKQSVNVGLNPIQDTKKVDMNIAIPLSEKLTIGNENNQNNFSKSKKILLILDVNGLLADIIHPPPKDLKSDINISRRAIFKRPFLDDFLRFCFERFNVAIWSSRTRKILDPVVNYLFGDLKKKLLFLWDLSHCTSSSFRSLENRHKFIVFKKLGKIWEENGFYDESNTLLLDDSPYKALLNPKHTGIFPLSYSYKDTNDNSLGPEGELRVYLEGVASATTENIETHVDQHPFGQSPIDETSPQWAFYSEVLQNVS